VKSLRDAGASRIQFDSPVATTVAALNAVRPQCGPVLDHRNRDEEYRVYSVIGRIARAKHERDGDIHIVLDDPDDASQHIVVELDDPDFRGNTVSPYRDKLAAARRMLEDLLQRTAGRQLTDLRGATVRVTGVGFFDMRHFQIGRSRSCMELHPILGIERVQADSSARAFLSRAEFAKYGD
jgi:hypothetical protein